MYIVHVYVMTKHGMSVYLNLKPEVCSVLDKLMTGRQALLPNTNHIMETCGARLSKNILNPTPALSIKKTGFAQCTEIKNLRS